MASEDYKKIYYSDLSDLIDRLKEVCNTCGITWEWTTPALGEEYPLSEEILLLYNKFLSTQENSRLAAATKWTIDQNELDTGSTLKEHTLNNALTSLLSMETLAADSKVANNAGTTYTQTTNTDGTTYSRTSHTNGTSYTETANKDNCVQNSSRNNSYNSNSKVCSCNTVYSSDNTRTSNTAATTYSRTSTSTTTHTQTSHIEISYTYTT